MSGNNTTSMRASPENFDNTPVNPKPRAKPKTEHDSQKSQNKKELREKRIEEIKDAWIESLILESEYINEGTEGIICIVKIGKLDADVREAFGIDSEIEGDQAMKILKIYNLGKGLAEYKAHQAVYELLSQHEGVAKVPRPFVYRDMPVKTEDLRIRLEYYKVRNTDRVQVFIMDLIDGDDLATHLYREAVRRHPNESQRVGVDELNIKQVYQRCLSAMALDRPDGENNTYSQKKAEERILDENAETLYDFLGEKGFTLSPEIRKKLEKTIDILGKNGILHRDLHSRNVMLGKDGEVYLIDFGKTRIVSKGEDPLYDGDPEKVPVEDEGILKFCERLETLNVQKDKDQSAEWITQLLKMRETYKNHVKNGPVWKKFFEQVSRRGAAISEYDVERLLPTTDLSDSLFVEQIMIGLLEIAKVSPQAAVDYLNSKIADKSIRPFVQVSYMQLLEHIKKNA